MYMKKNFGTKSNSNEFFQTISVKKQHIKILKSKIFALINVKKQSYRSISLNFPKKNTLKNHTCLIMYIIEILFSQTNTILNVMDFSGKLRFFCSIGTLATVGKQKKS